jgi:nucleoside-diphosphate-sugar epimerase
MKKVLILGNRGYVGSKLTDYLASEYAVSGIDIGWFTPGESRDYSTLTEQELESYNVVILVAGHSSVGTCIGNIDAPWANNVSNFVDLVGKLRKDQLLIYASSASVYGNSRPGEYHREGDGRFVPVNNYDITKYTLDLHAQLFIDQGYNIVGLRFGTVNGWSQYVRNDVMINAMYTSAITKDRIEITNRYIGRAILGIDDLARAVETIIDCPSPGIFNLASFNSTVGEIARAVSTRLMVPMVDNGNTDNAYDFGLSTDSFGINYNFTFIDTVVSIVNGLDKQWATSTLGRRDNYMEYNYGTL